MLSSSLPSSSSDSEASDSDSLSSLSYKMKVEKSDENLKRVPMILFVVLIDLGKNELVFSTRNQKPIAFS